MKNISLKKCHLTVNLTFFLKINEEIHPLLKLSKNKKQPLILGRLAVFMGVYEKVLKALAVALCS